MLYSVSQFDVINVMTLKYIVMHVTELWFVVYTAEITILYVRMHRS